MSRVFASFCEFLRIFGSLHENVSASFREFWRVFASFGEFWRVLASFGEFWRVYMSFCEFHEAYAMQKLYFIVQENWGQNGKPKS